MMRLHQSHSIKAILVDRNEDVLYIKNYELSYSMFSSGAKSDSGQNSKSQNKGFLKVNYLISQLDGAIIYNPRESQELEEFFSHFQNPFVVLPDLAETTLLEALHCKFNTVCGDDTFVEYLSITDTASGITYTLDAVDFDYHLPKGKWLGEFSYWEEPWWRRYDESMFDVLGVGADDVEEFRKTDSYNIMLSTMLDDIDSEVDKLFNQMEGKTADVVELDELRSQIERKGNKWKPTLV